MVRQGESADYPWPAQQDQPLETMSTVLVYGSLKSGQSNHHWLAGTEYLGEAQLPGLALYDLGPFPMAVASRSGRSVARLYGELYAVSASQLALLDELEGVPRLYRREQRQLASGEPVWVYVGQERQVRHATLLEQGRWEGPRHGARGRCEPLPQAET